MWTKTTKEKYCWTKIMVYELRDRNDKLGYRSNGSSLVFAHDETDSSNDPEYKRRPPRRQAKSTSIVWRSEVSNKQEPADVAQTVEVEISTTAIGNLL